MGLWTFHHPAYRNHLVFPFDNLELAKVKLTEEKFMEYMENFGKEVIEEIRTSKDLTEATESKLKKIIEEFISKQ